MSNIRENGIYIYFRLCYFQCLFQSKNPFLFTEEVNPRCEDSDLRGIRLESLGYADCAEIFRDLSQSLQVISGVVH
jgi:hypothetical protein